MLANGAYLEVEEEEGLSQYHVEVKPAFRIVTHRLVVDCSLGCMGILRTAPSTPLTPSSAYKSFKDIDEPPTLPAVAFTALASSEQPTP